MPFEMYRQGHGKRARMVMFLLLGLLGLYVSYSFYNSTELWVTNVVFAVGEFDVEIRHIGAAFFALIFVIAIYILTVRSKRSVDFLIETDSEMEKVSWPSSADVRSSAVVVLVTVVILSVFIWLVDMGWAALMRLLVQAR